MLPVVDLRAMPDPHERGTAYGRAAADPIAHSIRFYRWLLPAMLGQRWEDLADEVTELMFQAHAAAPNVVALLHGVAQGSGQAFADLAIVSCRSELMARASIGTSECTTLRFEHGLAQTSDWFITQREACVILRTDRMLTLTEAGMPAKIGLNTDGLAVTLNFLATTPAPTAPGVPVHVLIAEVLERSDSVAAALTQLRQAPVACSATIGLADPTGAAVFVELTPHAPPVVLDADDALVHTNHCLATTLARHDQRGPLFDNSQRRLERARELLAAGLPVSHILAEAGGADSIDVAARPDADSRVALGTVAAVVIDAQRREMVVSPSRPSVSGFVQRLRF